MPLIDPPNWDDALARLNKQVDAKQLFKFSEIENKILGNLNNDSDVTSTTKKYPPQVLSFLRGHEALVKSTIAELLVDVGASPHTYEYRGDFMAIGCSYCSNYSYTVCYHPYMEGKEGSISVIINDMQANCKTIKGFTLVCTPPSFDFEDTDVI